MKCNSKVTFTKIPHSRCCGFLLAFLRYCNLQWITIRRWHSLKYHSLGDMLLLTLWRYFNVKLNAIHRVSALLFQGGVNRILILINSKDMLEYIQCRHLSSCINLNTFSFSFIYITTLLSKLKDTKRIGSNLFKKTNGKRWYRRESPLSKKTTNQWDISNFDHQPKYN